MSTLTPDDFLVVSKQYNYTVPTYAELLQNIAQGLYLTGDRILVEHDENADGFWTLWAYRPSSSDNDEYGLVFEASQTYRTQDFFEVIDWYAPGYGPLNPPRVAYQNSRVRDLYELPAPKNTLVRIEDDGTTGWSWTAWDGIGWNVVAREKATIQFSDKFYDPNLPTFALDDVKVTDLANIPQRDGSWEIREIFNALRFNVLNETEMNELFFSMLSFYHSQQDQVDWAFKTSFLTVLGYNERLAQTPVALYDNTENLLDYLDEVKPYHVKVRDFSRVLTPDVEIVGTHATDFDKPPFYDTTLGGYRRLDPNVVEDMALMRATSPWSDWANHYQNDNRDWNSPEHNPVRHINLSMRFDRFDLGQTDDDGNLFPTDSGFGWDLAPWDILGFDGTQQDVDEGGAALTRLLAYYHPTLGMIEASPEELLSGWSYRGILLDGGDLYVPRGANLTDWGLRAFDTTPLESTIVVEKDVQIDRFMKVAPEVLINPTEADVALRDPYHLPGHPEELVPISTNCALSLEVETTWSQGAPHQQTLTLATARSRRATATISYDLIASNHEAILVYRDGIRAVEGTDYTIDFTNKNVTVKLGTPKASRVTVHVFGIAGSNAVREVRLFTADGAQSAFAFDNDPNGGTTEMYVDGFRVDATLDDRTMTAVKTPASGANVVLISYLGTAIPTQVAHQTLPVNTAQQWTLARPTVSGEPADHIGLLLTRDGKALNPPFTRYGDFADENRLVPFRELISTDALTVWLNGGLHPNRIGHLVDHGKPYSEDQPGLGWDCRAWDTDLYDVAGDVVLWRDHLWLNNLGLLVDYDLYAFDSDVFDRSGTLIPSDPPLEIKPGYTNANRVLAVAYLDHDYRVDNGKLTIVTPLAPTDYGFLGWDENPLETLQKLDTNTRLEATTFTNGDQIGVTTHTFFGSHAGTYRLPVKVASPDYLTVTRNGQRMTPGIDYTVSQEVMGFDDGTADHIGFGFSDDSNFTILTIPGGQEPYERINVTAFEGVLSNTPTMHTMMTTKPSAALMGDAVLASDWGYAPFDIIASGSNVSISRTVDGKELPLYRMNGSWQVFQHDTERRHRLERRVLADDMEIVVRLGNGSANPFTQPDLEKGVPGVLFIAGERIEYFLMDQTDDLVTFRQLRRATRGTRIGQEQRRARVVTGDGATTRFMLAGTTVQEALLDGCPIEVAVVGTDKRRAKPALTRDYTLADVEGGVEVIFKIAPANGASISLGQTFGEYHPEGEIVRDISRPLQDDTGPFRIRDIPAELDEGSGVQTYIFD